MVLLNKRASIAKPNSRLTNHQRLSGTERVNIKVCETASMIRRPTSNAASGTPATINRQMQIPTTRRLSASQSTRNRGARALRARTLLCHMRSPLASFTLALSLSMSYSVW